MATPLLKTRLYIPLVRPDVASRSRLIERLEEGLRLGCRLTLVSAPGGCGKTTLVSDWIARSQVRVAWLYPGILVGGVAYALAAGPLESLPLAMLYHWVGNFLFNTVFLVLAALGLG